MGLPHTGYAEWDDELTALVSAKAGGSAPTWAKLADDGSGSTGVYAWQFPTNAETELHFSMQLHHSWMEGTEIRPHVHWIQPDATAGKGVRWGLEYYVSSPAQQAPANTTIIGATGNTGSEIRHHHITGFDPIDLTGCTVSTVIICRVFRDHDHADDDYAQAVQPLYVDGHILKNSVGSQREYYKSLNG